MNISDLQRTVPPPAHPVEADAEGWSHVEVVLGSRLPDDFKDLINNYGSGRFIDFICVFNPFSLRENINLIHQVKVQLDALKVLKGFGEHCPYPLFPEAGGLLPFGLTDNGDVMHWLTSGPPENWKIVVNEARSPHYQLFESDLTSFLFNLLTGRVQCDAFPKSLSKRAPEFQPH